MTAAQWAAIAALLPRPARMGRPRVDDRRTLEAVLYQRRTGCAWARLPAALGDGATAHRRWREWQAAGLWERIEAILGTTPPTLEEPSAVLQRED
jgi:transposase